MDHTERIARILVINQNQVEAAVRLLDDDNTLPFIARYRKEATGSLDEEQLRFIDEEINRLRSLTLRRQVILNSIQEQGMLSDDLRNKIENADTITDLEDLYAPYRPKRRTRASVARERGLQPLAELILKQSKFSRSLDSIAEEFLGDELTNVEAAWAGARDIVAEDISDHAEIRRMVREKATQWGILHSQKISDAEDLRKVYEMYYESQLRVDKIKPHQVLAINRGEQDKILRVKLIVAERDWLRSILSVFPLDARSPLMEMLEIAVKDAAERLLLPAIERDVRRALTEKAEEHAIRVFGENLRALLSQPPLVGFTVLGIDPGFRTGCKLAVVDATGKLLETETIYPHEPQKRRADSLNRLAEIVTKHAVNLVAIGNGTASRETEHLVPSMIQTVSARSSPVSDLDRDPVRYLIVSEAGASVYSASKLARAEFPELDVSMRGAVSIARRVQDPLSELVKIDPKAIGVGMYQHDVDQKRLTETLNGVVESVVNQVGVDVNTASPALLKFVAGIGEKLADRIVAYRDVNGPFVDRNEFRKVTGFGAKAYEQAAGFLRIRDGVNILDASAIHPESYSLAVKILDLAGLTGEEHIEERSAELVLFLQLNSVETLAETLKAGVPTVTDIIEQLMRPGRDPRQDLPTPILRSDVLKMEDLVPGMRLKGTVRNVIDFGAFVDIGVKQDGLLHISQIPRGSRLSVGEILSVEVIQIDIERGRIALGWISD